MGTPQLEHLVDQNRLHFFKIDMYNIVSPYVFYSFLSQTNKAVQSSSDKYGDHLLWSSSIIEREKAHLFVSCHSFTLKKEWRGDMPPWLEEKWALADNERIWFCLHPGIKLKLTLLFHVFHPSLVHFYCYCHSCIPAGLSRSSLIPVPLYLLASKEPGYD